MTGPEVGENLAKFFTILKIFYLVKTNDISLHFQIFFFAKEPLKIAFWN